MEHSRAQRGTYRDLDAFQVIETGRVMVNLATAGHRMPEEYVPVNQLEGAVSTMAERLDEMTLLDGTGDPHDEGYMEAVREMRETLDHIIGGR